MLHTAEDSDAAHNSPESLIANPKGAAADGAYFKVGRQRGRQLYRDQHPHRPDEKLRPQIA